MENGDDDEEKEEKGEFGFTLPASTKSGTLGVLFPTGPATDKGSIDQFISSSSQLFNYS